MKKVGSVQFLWNTWLNFFADACSPTISATMCSGLWTLRTLMTRSLRGAIWYILQFLLTMGSCGMLVTYLSMYNFHVTLSRARQRHLLTSYLDKHKDAIALNNVIQDVLSALAYFQVFLCVILWHGCFSPICWLPVSGFSFHKLNKVCIIWTMNITVFSEEIRRWDRPGQEEDVRHNGLSCSFLVVFML